MKLINKGVGGNKMIISLYLSTESSIFLLYHPFQKASIHSQTLRCLSFSMMSLHLSLLTTIVTGSKGVHIKDW